MGPRSRHAASGSAILGSAALDRRGVLAGMGGVSLALASPWPARADAGLQQPLPPAAPSGPVDETRLLTNLVTRVVAEARLNGRRRAMLVLDTGAGQSALAEDLADDLGLERGPRVQVHGVTAVVQAPTAVVPRFEFNGRNFPAIQVLVFPRADLAADGLLGLDVLANFRVTFDLRRRRVRIQGGGAVNRALPFGPPTPSPSRQRNARRGAFGQLLMIDARVGGVPVEAFVDSGAQYSIGNLALRDALAARGGTGPAQPVRIFGVSGPSLMGEAMRTRGLELGQRRLEDAELLFADLHVFDALRLSDRPALLIGADLLIRFDDIGLDFAGQSIRFGRVSRA